MMLIRSRYRPACGVILVAVSIRLFPSCASAQQENAWDLSCRVDSLRVSERYKYFGDGYFGQLSGYDNKVRALINRVSLLNDSIVVEGVVMDDRTEKPLRDVAIYLGRDRVYRANVSKPDGSYAGGLGLYRIEIKDSSQTDADGSFVIRGSILPSTRLYFAKPTYFMDIYEVGKTLGDWSASKNNP